MRLNVLYEAIVSGTGGPVSKPSFIPYSTQVKVGQVPKPYQGGMSTELANFIKRVKDYNLDKKINKFKSTEVRLQKQHENERILQGSWDRLSDQDKKTAETILADDPEVNLKQLDKNKEAKFERDLQRDIKKELKKRLGSFSKLSA